MDNHGKKMIAPIVITVLMVLYYILYFSILIFAIPVVFVRIVFGIVPVLLAGVMIYVCIQRIYEIKGGEEDDLSKY